MVKKVILLFALVLMVFLLIGCRTVQGIGADIQWIGEKGVEAMER